HMRQLMQNNRVKRGPIRIEAGDQPARERNVVGSSTPEGKPNRSTVQGIPDKTWLGLEACPTTELIEGHKHVGRVVRRQRLQLLTEQLVAWRRGVKADRQKEHQSSPGQHPDR